MGIDLIRGKTLRFTFDDGQMAGKAFDHVFDENGTVAFHPPGKPGGTPATKYEVATVRDGVCAVSYLSPGGYTLTTILDFASKKLVAFSSNEKTLGIQHGTFEEVGATKPKNGAQPHARSS